jgi:hypothetical protein
MLAYIQNNGIQLNVFQKNGIQNNIIKHNGIQHIDIQPYSIRHNEFDISAFTTSSFIPLSITVKSTDILPKHTEEKQLNNHSLCRY